MGARPSQPQLKDISVKRGENITLSWTTKRGISGTWKKEDKLLRHGGRVIISHNDSKEFHLTITGAKEEDEGQYTLELENSRGKESGSANVKVLEYDSDWRHLNWDPANIEKRNESVKKKLREFPISNPEVSQLRFLLHGITSYGKSTLINSIMTVFKQRVITLVPTAASSDKSHTKCFKSYMIADHQNRALPLIFSDTMGVEIGEGGVLAADVVSALKGHVMDGYEFNIDSPLSEEHASYKQNPSLSDQFHCLVTVISANKISALENTSACTGSCIGCNNCLIHKKMKDVRSAIGATPQVVLMTHVDECCPLVKADLKHIYSSKSIKQTMQRCSNALGVPMTCIFPVKNYHEETAVDSKTDCLILDALEKIVHFANDYVHGKSSVQDNNE